VGEGAGVVTRPAPPEVYEARPEAPLVVMPSNNTGATVRSIAQRFPGRLAHLIGPGGWRTPFLPYALDNGAFGAWASGTPFNEDAFCELLARAQCHEEASRAGGSCEAPLWVAVPDVVADRRATLDSWGAWAPRLRRYGWPLAFVVQDEMVRQDVPGDADVVFVGGTTKWKWSTVPAWCAWFRRVHVGRVNRPRALDYLDQLGAESCDGTGWLRGDQVQLNGLIDFLAGRTNLRLFDAPDGPLPAADEEVTRDACAA